ncbi:MAG TPA: Fic family protein [Pseudobdellovibrionaceae bacterium]|nr:Fic family protein [Pseudobdellovibrionaceae bacterium]
MSQKATRNPVGYSYLLEHLKNLGLKPLSPTTLCYVLDKGENQTVSQGQFITKFYKKRYWPGESLWSQIEFALKYEDLQLGILKLLLEQMDSDFVFEYITNHKSQKYTRLIWFFYEWLLGRKLEIDEVQKESYFPILDPEVYFTASAQKLKRYNIENNLLGNAQFCPIIRRTDKLKQISSQSIRDSVAAVIDTFDIKILERAAYYLYAKETKSSFEIERDHPDKTRSARFIQLLKMADQDTEINKESLIKWQNTIVDSRFAEKGYRKSQNYVGETLYSGREQIHYISPKPEDLESLMEGLLLNYRNMIQSKMDPVLIATITSFAFVYIHPFEDGNGRVHRFLIHKILSSQKLTPNGVIFPVSSTMFNNMNEYDDCLESFSKRILDLIDYDIDSEGIMTVQQKTSYFYQYMDFTAAAEYLFDCISKTIDVDFRQEIEYLQKYDSAKKQIISVVDMPDRHIDNLIRSIISNKGRFSKRTRKRFDFLSDAEFEELTNIISKEFKL